MKRLLMALAVVAVLGLAAGCGSSYAAPSGGGVTPCPCSAGK